MAKKAFVRVIFGYRGLPNTGMIELRRAGAGGALLNAVSTNFITCATFQTDRAESYARAQQEIEAYVARNGYEIIDVKTQYGD